MPYMRPYGGRDSGGTVLGFLAGCVAGLFLGAALGVLMAPHRGDITRRKIVRRAGEAGVRLTPAGASFPYGVDPRDRNIRLAPTMPSVDEIRQAMELFCTCVELVCSERLRCAT